MAAAWMDNLLGFFVCPEYPLEHRPDFRVEAAFPPSPETS
ncbi:hypothetical protein Btus_1070 [Kyrpidia tusciae DSM 2912]|uniref:Uncharacterized protein n=1 Tax=Kyrpidia tusciae (strain DSM 2912 / NBRC 15312 / T2) TaxID=562970 RepID=D5WWV6_KYRT2|nr:hypothetical protein Btus_1070 [Kyrpidia tusciae DSM 2912]